MVPEILARLKKHFDVDTEEDIHDKLDIDTRRISLDYIGPGTGARCDHENRGIFPG